MEETRTKTRLTGLAAAIVCACLALTLVGCNAASTSSASASSSDVSSSMASGGSSRASNSASGEGSSSGSSNELPSPSAGTAPEKADIVVNETITNAVDGEHAIEQSGSTGNYANVAVEKTGDSNDGNADFYGDNAAVFATEGATLTLSNMVIESNGSHANGVFSYGEGTTVNVSDSVIETRGNGSGGLMTTGGGTMNASNMRILTSGNSSAAIRSDRGGGTVNVDGGVYATSGTGSPVIYSTADITVSNAYLESTASQGVVVEGKNSVTLNDSNLVANNNKKNSNKSSYYQAVMIYQSMSGDAAEGKASFAMNGGSLTNANGDVFFVNNTVASISLNGASITNNGDGVFLRAAAAGWGSEGSNGGQVTLNATNQAIAGDMVVDSVSNLNMYLSSGSTFTGAVNADGQAGDVYVDLTGGSKWVLTGDSYITSLTCDVDSIDLNGHTLYVGGQAYTADTASTGTPIEVVVSKSSGHGGAPDQSGQAPSGGTPPEKPSGGSSSSSNKPSN